MRLRSSKKESESESGGLFSSKRSTSTDQTTGKSTSRIGRARAKYGLGALLVVAGIALFLFPEPITSTAGIAMIAIGALIWIVGRVR